MYGAAPNARILVVGNKRDLESGRRVKATEAMDFADRIKADYTETSATDGKSVELMFDLLATRIYDELVVPNGTNGDCQVPEGITLSASIAEPKEPKTKCGCV